MYGSSTLNPRVPGAPPDLRCHEETIPVLAIWFGSWQISLRRRAMSGRELARCYERAAPGWSRTLDRLGYPGAYETVLRDALGDGAPGTMCWHAWPIRALRSTRWCAS
jgi:hypothetical protein